jgi:hypothetical protein
MNYNNLLYIPQVFKSYITANHSSILKKNQNIFKISHSNNDVNLSSKLKISDNMKKYLNNYNRNYLKNYINTTNNNKMIIHSELFPIDPNNYIKLFSITHILSFLAGYYLSNFLNQ